MKQLENIVAGARTVRRGGYLYHNGDRRRSLLAVRSGLVKIVNNTAQGHEQVTGFRLPGELLGLETLANDVSENSALAIETSSVCRIPVAPLLRLSRNSASFQHHLYRLVSRQLANRNMEFTILGKHKAEAGLVALLANLAERYRARGYSGTDFNLSMSRAEIGSYLGITLETVSRLFSRLQKEGLLRVDKRHITILEPDRLRSVAGYPFAVDGHVAEQFKS